MLSRRCQSLKMYSRSVPNDVRKSSHSVYDGSADLVGRIAQTFIRTALRSSSDVVWRNYLHVAERRQDFVEVYVYGRGFL